MAASRSDALVLFGVTGLSLRALPYKRRSWGPKEADAIPASGGSWHNPRRNETSGD
jgi:hypothetical protein